MTIDYHDELPAGDPRWLLITFSLGVISWGCAIWALFEVGIL